MITRASKERPDKRLPFPRAPSLVYRILRNHRSPASHGYTTAVFVLHVPCVNHRIQPGQYRPSGGATYDAVTALHIGDAGRKHLEFKTSFVRNIGLTLALWVLTGFCFAEHYQVWREDTSKRTGKDNEEPLDEGYAYLASGFHDDKGYYSSLSTCLFVRYFRKDNR